MNDTALLSALNADADTLLSPLARVPIILRQLIAANRAGVNQFFVLCSKTLQAKLSDLLKNEMRLQAEVTWLNNIEQLRRISGLQQAVFFIKSGYLFEPGILDKLKESYDTGADNKLCLYPDVIPAGIHPSQSGVFLTRSENIIELVSQTESDTGKAKIHSDRNLTYQAIAIDTNLLPYAVRQNNLQAAVKMLLQRVGKSNDSMVIRYIRKSAAILVKFLLNTSLKPNHVTWTAGLIGLVAAFLIFKTSYFWVLAGSLMFILAWIVDCADGMLARITFEESPYGANLDFILDNVVHIAIFVAMTNTIYHQTRSAHVLYGGGLLVFGGVMAFLMVFYHLKTVKSYQTVPDKKDEVVAAILDHLTHRDFCLWIFLFALLGRLEIFFWAAVAGVNFFWLLYFYFNLRQFFNRQPLSVY